MTSRRHTRWTSVAAFAVAAVCLTVSSAAIAQMRPGPIGPGPIGPGPIGPFPCPDCGRIVVPPPPPLPPPPCPDCGRMVVPSPPPQSPCTSSGCAPILQQELVSPLSGTLAPTGVPLQTADQDQADDLQLQHAIHMQWLRYLQSIQQNHRDEHWKELPYDAWLRRHPEDQEVAPTPPENSVLSISEPYAEAKAGPEPDDMEGWWIAGVAVAVLVSAVLIRKRRSRR